MKMSLVFFFFSSRRRHTRCLSDWSSDVCSSDLYHFDDRSTRIRRTFLMPVGYAMLRVLRESEYLRRPPGLKKFRGCYPARVISPVGGIPHAVSPGARVMMKPPVSTNPNERYRATAAMFSRPTASAYSTSGPYVAS